jgi:hypothetical protein
VPGDGVVDGVGDEPDEPVAALHRARAVLDVHAAQALRRGEPADQRRVVEEPCVRHQHRLFRAGAVLAEQGHESRLRHRVRRHGLPGRPPDHGVAVAEHFGARLGAQFRGEHGDAQVGVGGEQVAVHLLGVEFQAAAVWRVAGRDVDQVHSRIVPRWHRVPEQRPAGPLAMLNGVAR